MNKMMQNDSMFYSPSSSENDSQLAVKSFPNSVFNKDGEDDDKKNSKNFSTELSQLSYKSLDLNLDAHTKLEEKRSAPPSNAPPIFIPTSPEPLFKDLLDDHPKAINDDPSSDENEDYNQNNNEGDDEDDCNDPEKGGVPKGILRYRSSVRDPNAAGKKVTFGALPRRQGDANPCIVLVLVVVFIISIISFLLVLMVIKGSIKTSCSCTDDIKKTQTAFRESTLNCPVGWSVGEQSCYGFATPSSQAYNDARLSCAKHGAYILSLETKEEADWFMRNILQPREEYDASVSEVFLGIKPRSEKTNYSWESNKMFYDWKRNIPEAGDNKCFVILKDRWKITNCTVKYAFYCEKPKYS